MNIYKSNPMKKIVIFSVLMIIYPIIKSSAQNPNFERLNNYKIGFFTKKLNLTAAEAEKFWPVYNQMRAELKVVMDKEMDLRKGKSVNDMKDDELNKLINSHFDNEQAMLDIKRK